MFNLYIQYYTSGIIYISYFIELEFNTYYNTRLKSIRFKKLNDMYSLLEKYDQCCVV